MLTVLIRNQNLLLFMYINVLSMNDVTMNRMNVEMLNKSALYIKAGRLQTTILFD